MLYTSIFFGNFSVTILLLTLTHAPGAEKVLRKNLGDTLCPVGVEVFGKLLGTLFEPTH